MREEQAKRSRGSEKGAKETSGVKKGKERKEKEVIGKEETRPGARVRAEQCTGQEMLGLSGAMASEENE